MAPTKRPARQIPRQDEDGEPFPPPRQAATPIEENGDEEVEDGDEEPAGTIRRGFSAGRQTMDSTSSFASAFKLTEQIQIIKFLEDEPYANYTRHWIERQTPTGTAPRSFTCLKSFQKRCPLCEAGDKAQAVSAFNIALVGDDGVPTLKTFDCGPKLFNIVENYARDPKVAPLSKGYFLASRSGKMGTVNYQLVPVKPRSLEEDYNIVPPSPEEFAKLGLWDSKIITMPKTKDLEGIAAEIADDY